MNIIGSDLYKTGQYVLGLFCFVFLQRTKKVWNLFKKKKKPYILVLETKN